MPKDRGPLLGRSKHRSMTPPGPTKVGILGAGSWGTVLGILADAAGCDVTLWCRDTERASRYQRSRINDRYLPGHALPERLRVTADFEEVPPAGGILILAVPTAAVREVAGHLKSCVTEDTVLVSACKGIEPETGWTVSKVLNGVLSGRVPPERITVLSGPNLAGELAAGLPAVGVIAGPGEPQAARVQAALSSTRFRLYTSHDVVGVECGGALKNIIAIGSGIVTGLELGENARASLLVRGLAEITRLGVHLGADPITFQGISGAGDLIATCSSTLSRNHRVGRELALGRSLRYVLDHLGMVAEGVPTTRAVHRLALREGISMPITREIHAVLFEGRDPREAVEALMQRALKSEREFDVASPTS